jgi:glutathione S-transferase
MARNGVSFIEGEHMIWADIVGLLAAVQLLVFGYLVGAARSKYGIKAPATTGHPVFEAWFRVQANTVEMSLAFFPALWLAARYWNPAYAAVGGVVYLIGRVVYAQGYVKDPSKRGMGFGLSFLPVTVLIVGALIGAVRQLLAHGT